MYIVRVGLDVPLAQTFDYRCGHRLAVGARVLVPFGRRHLVGVVLDIGDTSEVAPDRLKSIARTLPEPCLSADDLRLLRFTADYYHYPLGQVVMNALPQRLKTITREVVRDEYYAVTPAGLAADANELPVRARAKRKLLSAFRSGRVLAYAAARAIATNPRAALTDFVTRGWIERTAAPPDALTVEHGAIATSAAHPLTPHQNRAVDTICAHLHHFQAFLLCGVTGSGKTEVYLRVAETALSAGRQVLMLVPEIALTPQLEAMVRARFPGVALVSLHSSLNESERARNWVAAQSRRAQIVLGTRLAVFTPLPALGLVIVDEEHDTSLKQTEGCCYSARDLAVVRAQQREVPVVLGSATPALESYYNATTGRYTLVELPERINARPPRIECIPVDAARARDGLSPRLLEALRVKLERAEQSLVFINRRGYAPVLMCHSCGWLSGCHRCSAKLVMHMPRRELHCHHCGHQAPVPGSCPSCGNPALAPLGQGTQRIEEALQRHFPQARILRIDRDTTRRKGSWSGMRERIRDREVDILVGTQILAKGHDFPHLALVGVLNADGMLYSADFRAAERLYALLTQVAGRAGRGEAEGEVLIQTEFPEHPLYAALRAQDVHGYAHRLLAERGAGGFPPYVHQALLRAEATHVEAALEFLIRARAVGGEITNEVELFDAVPASMVRLAGRERAQLLVQSASRPALQAFLREWTQRLAGTKSAAARWALEVDPAEL
jgi:primosomal protein N' (replication factor Y) (superfamily II helicase)